MNSCVGYPTYRISSADPSTTWVHLHIYLDNPAHCLLKVFSLRALGILNPAAIISALTALNCAYPYNYIIISDRVRKIKVYIFLKSFI